MWSGPSASISAQFGTPAQRWGPDREGCATEGVEATDGENSDDPAADRPARFTSRSTAAACRPDRPDSRSGRGRPATAPAARPDRGRPARARPTANTPRPVLGDKAYSHPSTRAVLPPGGDPFTSPEKSDQVARRQAKALRWPYIVLRPPAPRRAQIDAERIVVERCFNPTRIVPDPAHPLREAGEPDRHRGRRAVATRHRLTGIVLEPSRAGARKMTKIGIFGDVGIVTCSSELQSRVDTRCGGPLHSE